MALAASLRNALGFVKRAIGYRSLATASLIQDNLPRIPVPLRPEGRRIMADAIGLSLDPKRHAFYLPLLHQALDLVRVGGGRFGLNEDGDPEFAVGNLRLVPKNVDDLVVLHEVFARRLYETFDSREWFVLDVGANVGYSALYFAGVLGWEVLGYEPFPSTFAMAARNVAANGLEGRIQLREAAISETSGRPSGEFNENSRSTNGLMGNLQEGRKTADVRAEITLVDAAEALTEALATAGERPLFLKLDCEGCEYEILDRVAARGLLARVAALVVEYHFVLPEHRAERLRALLLAHGYFLKTLWTGVDAEGLLAVRITV